MKNRIPGIETPSRRIFTWRIRTEWRVPVFRRTPTPQPLTKTMKALKSPGAFLPILTILIGFAFGTLAPAQTLSTGIGGNWADGPTWENGLVPSAANGPFTIVGGDVLVADGNFNFPDLTTLTIEGGAVLELEYLPGGVPVNPIDPANTVTLNGGVIRTSTSNPGAGSRGFNPGSGGGSPFGGVQVTADSAIENAFSSNADSGGGTARNLNLNRGGLAIDPGAIEVQVTCGASTGWS